MLINSYTAKRGFVAIEEMTLRDAGFTIIENCCAPSECDDIVIQLGTISGPGTRCLLDDSWCQTLSALLKRRVARAIPEISSLVAVQCTLFNKSSASNWLVTFHQDRSIPVAPSVVSPTWPGWSQKEGMTFIHGTDELLAQMVAVRLHVDPCTSGNGPLRVIPGSHRAGTLSSEAIDDLREMTDEQQLLVGRGGVVVMRPMLLHASSKSHTIEARRILHFLFGPKTPPAGLQWRLAV